VNFALDGFFMVLGRLSGLFISAPIFASRQLPGRMKVLIIILLSAIMSSFVPIKYEMKLDNSAIFIAAFVSEVFIGYAIGFVAYVIFAAIQLAGQLMDTQMGFSIVNVLDPQSGTQIPLMGNFNYLLALIIYLSLDGHHYLLQAIADSYQIIPVLGANLGKGFIYTIASMTTYMFIIAAKIAAPIVVTVLITDISMGFISRTVPQMNVFMVGMPVKIMVGLLALLILMPIYIWFMGLLLSQCMEYVDLIVHAMGL
jgi:flagellar biosynthetic protein FliR